jgi:hypothetical protein
MEGTFSTNGGKEKCIKIIGEKAGGKETIRKTKTYVGG